MIHDSYENIFQSIKEINTNRPLEILHTELFGPISTKSLREKSYGFVILNYYIKFT